MKKLAVVFIACAAGQACTAQSPASSPAATVWEKGVPPQPGARADFGDHSMSILQRKSSGKAEVHATKSDVVVVQSGSATLVTGGVVVNPANIAPEEIQGASIQGGTTRTVNVGDVIEIPAGVPHQFLLAPGTQITYLLVKVNRPQAAASQTANRPAP